MGLISNAIVKLNSDKYSDSAYKTYENYANEIDEIEPEIKNPSEFTKFTKLIKSSNKVYKNIYEKLKLLLSWLDN